MYDGDENYDVGALTGEGKNQLSYLGKPCPAHEHIDEIIHGFSETYDFILAHREQIERLLHLFDRAQFRKLLRPTEVYGRLCDRLTELCNFADEAARVKYAEKLRRAYEKDADPLWVKRMERVCQSEIDAVLRGDIPYFFSRGDELALRDFKGVVCDDYFALSPVDNAIKRLDMLSGGDKRDQMKIIAQSLEAVNPNIESRPTGSARRVFEMLESNALDGNPCSWIGVDMDDKGRAYLQSIGFDLYNGLLGVLCFYAALYEATGDMDVKNAIERRYAPYRTMYIEKRSQLIARADTINLTNGVGGHILALTYIAECLGDDRYYADAKRLLSRFDFENCEDITETDVYGGISGLLISLPLLPGAGADKKNAQTAKRLGDALTHSMPKLTGLAHGAAGEALALASAQTVLGDDRYEAQILRLLERENASYDENAHNWSDLRDPDKHGFMQGICSGAPGIAAARAQMLNLHVSDTIKALCRSDMDRARGYYEALRGKLKRDSLCCGNSARIEGEKLLFGEVTVSETNEAPVFFHSLETNDFPAGLFQGWAGVGYALTRKMTSSKTGIFVRNIKEE